MKRAIDLPRAAKVVAVCVGAPLVLWLLFDLLKTLALLLALAGAVVAWRVLRAPAPRR